MNYPLRFGRAKVTISGWRIRASILSLALLLAANGCSNSPADDDALLSLFRWYSEKVESISPASYCTVVRLAFTLILQTIACGVIFAHARGKMQNGSLMVIQWLACLVIFMGIVQIPLDGIFLNSSPKAFIFTISLFAIGALPPHLAGLLVSREGARKIAAATIYGMAALFTLIQIIR